MLTASSDCKAGILHLVGDVIGLRHGGADASINEDNGEEISSHMICYGRREAWSAGTSIAAAREIHENRRRFSIFWESSLLHVCVSCCHSEKVLGPIPSWETGGLNYFLGIIPA